MDLDHDAYLLHQVHGAKLAADAGADVVSTWLMWRRHPAAALAVAHVVAAAGSAVVLRRDLSRLARTRRGRYVVAHMPPSAQAVRYLGQVIAWRAAYRRQPAGIVAGHAVVVAAWAAHGLVSWASTRRRRQAV